MFISISKSSPVLNSCSDSKLVPPEPVYQVPPPGYWELNEAVILVP